MYARLSCNKDLGLLLCQQSVHQMQFGECLVTLESWWVFCVSSAEDFAHLHHSGSKDYDIAACFQTDLSKPTFGNQCNKLSLFLQTTNPLKEKHTMDCTLDNNETYNGLQPRP